jgi:hypothetical protein
LDLNAAFDRCMTLPCLEVYRALDPIEKLSILDDFMTGLFDEFVPWLDASVGRTVLERDIAYRFWKAQSARLF